MKNETGCKIVEESQDIRAELDGINLPVCHGTQPAVGDVLREEAGMICGVSRVS